MSHRWRPGSPTPGPAKIQAGPAGQPRVLGAAIVNAAQMGSQPLVLALALAAAAVLSLAVAILASVRQRRAELALLKALGLTRRQVREVIGWQASAILVIACVVGVPLGVAAGRWAGRPCSGLPCSEPYAGVAQLAEQPSCKRQVSGSNPLTGSQAQPSISRSNLRSLRRDLARIRLGCVPEPTYTVKALDESTWAAFAALVERNNGIFGGCWCMAFHPEDSRNAAHNRAAKEQRVREGQAHAALVFDGDDCVGWCQFGAPGEVPRIKNQGGVRKRPDGLTRLANRMLLCREGAPAPGCGQRGARRCA